MSGPEDEMVEFSRKLADIELGLELATAPKKVDLSEFGISHNRCIEPGADMPIIAGIRTLYAILKQTKPTLTSAVVSLKGYGTYNTCPHRMRILLR